MQPMVETGIETIVGVTQDPSFGPLVLFGMGGIGAELVRDTVLRLVPLTDVDAADLVRPLRSSPLLFGYRGAAPPTPPPSRTSSCGWGCSPTSCPRSASSTATRSSCAPTGCSRSTSRSASPATPSHPDGHPPPPRPSPA